MKQMPLPQTLNITTAALVQAEILAALDAGETLELDASGVCEMDTAGLQLLMACHLHAKQTSLKLRITATSPAVEAAFMLAGLHKLLDEIKEVTSEKDPGS